MDRLGHTFEERLGALVESRPAIGRAASESQKAPVIDIMEALRCSLEAKRKPIRGETRSRTASKVSAPKRKRS
jgi:non-homologous end joining protein Ku